MMSTEQILTDALGDESQISYEDLAAVLSPAQLHTLAVRCADTKDTLLFDEATMHDRQQAHAVPAYKQMIQDARKENYHISIRGKDDE